METDGVVDEQLGQGRPAAAPLSLGEAARRYGIVPADLVALAPLEAPAEEAEPDAPERAIGRRIDRVDVEELFATVYLTFEDATYLTYAARLDDEGVILLDRFSPPAAHYSDYWVFDDLEGESGPPPPHIVTEPGSPYDPARWSEASGRTVTHIGWYEEGMQVFLHFGEGGYLTLAARSSAGAAYLVGYVAGSDPASDEDYIIFDPPAQDGTA